MKRFIFNADDFGWTPGHNRAVERAHREGVLDRASLMANGAAFDDAVAVAGRNPRLAVGVHLTLLEGSPVSPPAQVSRLIDANGRFPDGLVPLITRWQFSPACVRQIAIEWGAQLDKVRRAGITPSHLDSHKHVHLLPALCGVVIALARAHGVPYVRLPMPSLSTLPLRGLPVAILAALALPARIRLRRAGLLHADHFVGFAQSGAMTAAALRDLLAHAPDGTSEIMLHPALLSDELRALGQRYRWARHYRFTDELEALCDPEVRALAAHGR